MAVGQWHILTSAHMNSPTPARCSKSRVGAADTVNDLMMVVAMVVWVKLLIQPDCFWIGPVSVLRLPSRPKANATQTI